METGIFKDTIEGQKKYHYLFGPVPSRRFGRSLGVDLTPHKICCYDCVFCQLGHTTRKTVDRKAYVDVDQVLAELDHWHISGGRADVVTLSGSGEPTLHISFGEVLDTIRRVIGLPAVLLTNGAMLNRPEVREAAGSADVVKVSLSAWNQASFEWVNRPHPSLAFEEVLAGQKRFRKRFPGQLWMEVFLIHGLNDKPDTVGKIAALARDIRPDRIQLNTAVRPPSEDFVKPVGFHQMASLTGLFEPAAEIIADFDKAIYGNGHIDVTQENILAMLQRRPCTARQIAEGYDIHLNEVLKYLGKLLRSGLIRTELTGDAVYYTANE